MNPMTFVPVFAAAALVIFAPDADAATAKAVAQLKDAQGKTVGSVDLGETPSGVLLVTAKGSGLPAGQHAIHIHQTGKCDAAGGFKSAGDHLAGDRKHGVLSEGGPHPGDLPNLYVQNDGKWAFEAFASSPSAGGGWFEAVELFDDDGAAIVIHAAADDYTTQPSGNSGDRIACGVLEKP